MNPVIERAQRLALREVFVPKSLRDKIKTKKDKYGIITIDLEAYGESKEL